MSEKLFRSRCTVPGHGMRCSVAGQAHPSKKELSKIRRRQSKIIINTETEHLLVCDICMKSEMDFINGKVRVILLRNDDLYYCEDCIFDDRLDAAK